MKVINRVLAGVLASVLLCTNSLFAHKPQESLWDQRQKTLQLASLPANFNPLPIKNIIPTKVSPTGRTGYEFQGIGTGIQPKNGGGLPGSFLSHVNVKDVFRANPDSQIIVLEDVHQNLEAQTHISQALI